MATPLIDSPASHVANMLTKCESGIGLRIGTGRSGCAGYADDANYTNKFGDQDPVFESHRSELIVDRPGLPQTDGVEVDLCTAVPLDKGFTFRGSNARDLYTCGDSFKV